MVLFSLIFLRFRKFECNIFRLIKLSLLLIRIIILSVWLLCMAFSFYLIKVYFTVWTVLDVLYVLFGAALILLSSFCGRPYKIVLFINSFLWVVVIKWIVSVWAVFNRVVNHSWIISAISGCKVIVIIW